MFHDVGRPSPLADVVARYPRTAPGTSNDSNKHMLEQANRANARASRQSTLRAYLRTV